MTAWRQVLELAIKDEALSRLKAIARSRTESASRVERALMLLAYREDPSFFAIGRALGVHHQTVQRCVERAVTGPKLLVGARFAIDNASAFPYGRGDSPLSRPQPPQAVAKATLYDDTRQFTTTTTK